MWLFDKETNLFMIDFIKGGEWFCINIYELAHKCKEWALNKGYIISSGATTSHDWCCTIYKIIKENPYIEELSHTWGQLEVEAIIQACEWILKEINAK